VDTHTARGPTRTLLSGLPPLPGADAAAKMEYFRAHHDGVRRFETGFMPGGIRSGGTVRMETPSGLVTLLPQWEDGSVKSAALRPSAAFTWSASERLDVGGRAVPRGGAGLERRLLRPSRYLPARLPGVRVGVADRA
jgi:proline racemase